MATELLYRSRNHLSVFHYLLQLAHLKLFQPKSCQDEALLLKQSTHIRNEQLLEENLRLQQQLSSTEDELSSLKESHHAQTLLMEDDGKYKREKLRFKQHVEALQSELAEKTRTLEDLVSERILPSSLILSW
jgi:hypothetical protein